MSNWKHAGPIGVILMALAVGCAPAGSSSGAEAAAVPRSSATLKRMTLGVRSEQAFRPGVGVPNLLAFQMVHSGLTIPGDQRIRRPRLAEAVPSLENGLWKLLADGRMETTWRLREGARWHDGVPLTSDDLLFSLEVGRDRELSGFNVEAYGLIEEASAPDPRTLVLTWKGPFIDADTVLGGWSGGILPKHLLEDAYRSDKASFLDLPYWTSEFVGAGPYRLRESILAVGLLLDANDDYVLGRPRIDQIEVKYIPDANTLSSNLLAGTVDVTNNVGSIDLGVQIRDQWRGGTVAFNLGADNWAYLVPQFVDPRPAVVADVQFRRALAHAIDRQEMVDTLVAGMSPVAHSRLSPNQAAYRDIEAAMPRYEYDPTRAAQLLDARGYRKGADGMYRDEAGRRLELEVRSGSLEEFAKAALAVAAYWQRLGVDATAVRTSPQQAQDPQYVATFPAFSLHGSGNDVNGLRFLHSSQARLPSNNFRIAGPGNQSRYMNPEFDALLETYFRTVPVPERIQALGQIIRHQADQVTFIGLFYRSDAGAISDRMLNLGREWPGSMITWNAHEWDVRP